LSNAEIAAELEALRQAFSSGDVSVDDVGPAFERLTFGLMGVTTVDERTLASLVNDIERIRFTRLPETQRAEIAEVLVGAVAVFARYLPGPPGELQG
jgi:hypothetical protein